LEKFNECVEDASRAIDLDVNMSKAYYRRMTAYEKIGETLRALQDCQKWMTLAPDDQTAKVAYDRLHNKILEDKKQAERKRIKWSKIDEEVNFIEKAAHLQSKVPLKQIPIRIKKSRSPIPDAVIDKIFNNNTGECVFEAETDSKLFKSNFLQQSYTKPKPMKPNIASPQVIEDNKAKVNETNEILKANDVIKKEQQQIPSIHELEAKQSHFVSTPESGPQFYCVWKELAEEVKFLYLKNIAESELSFGKLLGAQLDSDMLSELIYVMHKYFVHFNISYLKLLHELSKNSELSLLAMFLDSNDKQSNLIQISPVN
jgi:hypothetical protein